MDHIPSGLPSGLPSAPHMPHAPEVKNPFSEQQMETLKNETKEFLDKFGEAYLPSYKTTLIKKVKADLKGNEPSPFKLKAAPDHEEPEIVMSGYLTKRGEVVKNWKKRFFVLKSDGSCFYFVKEGDTKPKGTIGLEGYHVKADYTGEVFSGKQFFWTLEDEDEERRTWYIFADGEDEKRDWVQAFHQACRIAKSYVNPDKVVRTAFATAYTAVRRAYGLYDRPPRGTEQEALSHVIYERLYRVLISDVVKNLESMAKKLAIKTAKTLISTAVTAAWKGFEQSCAKLRPSVEAVLKKAMGPFIDAELDIKTKIRETVGQSLINPIVEKALSPFFSQVLGILYPVIIESFSTQLTISIDVCKKAAADLKDSQNPAHVFKELKKTLDIRPATKKLPMKNLKQWEKDIDQILTIVGKLEGEVGEFARNLKKEIDAHIKPSVDLIFPGSIEEQMLKFSKNTLYTFEVDFKESQSPDAASRTIAKLHYDLALIFEHLVHDSLKGFVIKPFQQHLKAPADKLISPLEKDIPDDLKEFIDPQGLLDEVLDQTLNDAISSATGSGVHKLTDQLNTTLTEKGIQVLSVSD